MINNSTSISLIHTANDYYNSDDYVHALPLYIEILKNECNDAMTWYRTAYSYRMLYGFNSNTYSLYYQAYQRLSTQMPNSVYTKYAWNQIFNVNQYFKVLPATGIRAENGDLYGVDNDGDGRRETVFVHGYYRKDGTYVRSHYRAK